MTWVRITSFCTYIFVPSLQINNKADGLQRKEKLLEKTKTQFQAEELEHVEEMEKTKIQYEAKNEAKEWRGSNDSLPAPPRPACHSG